MNASNPAHRTLRPETRRTAKKGAGLFLLSLCLIFFASPVFAACCKCRSASDPTKQLCLTTPGECPNLQAEANNDALADVTCDGVTSLKEMAGECRMVVNGGVCQVLAPAATYGKGTAAGAPKGAPVASLPMTLNVGIPGLSFAKSIQEVGGYLEIPFLAQYVTAGYNYLLGIVVIAAAVMVIWGGFKYILSSSAKGVQDGKDAIKDAIIGLLLVFGIVTIFQTLNPDLVNFKALRIAVIQPDPFDKFYKSGNTADLASYNKMANGETPPPLPGCPAEVPKPANPAGINSWDRMQAACGKDLKSVIQVWLEEGKAGAAYIRGGVNGGKDLKLFPPQTGFMVAVLFKNTPAANAYNYMGEDTVAACGIDINDLSYSGDETRLPSKELRDANAQIIKSNGKIKTPCFAMLERDYTNREVNPIKCNNMLGTDCGLFVSQISKCGGKPIPVADINFKIQKRVQAEQIQSEDSKPDINENGKINIYQYSGGGFKDVEFTTTAGKPKKMQIGAKAFVSKAVCAALGSECSTLVSYSGGNTFDGVSGFQKIYPGHIGFGAAISFLCGGVGHFILYTGGVGLPFEVIESGGKGSAQRLDKSLVSFPSIKQNFKYGIQTTPTLSGYLSGAGCQSGQMWFVN